MPVIDKKPLLYTLDRYDEEMNMFASPEIMVELFPGKDVYKDIKTAGGERFFSGSIHDHKEIAEWLFDDKPQMRLVDKIRHSHGFFALCSLLGLATVKGAGQLMAEEKNVSEAALMRDREVVLILSAKHNEGVGSFEGNVRKITQINSELEQESGVAANVGDSKGPSGGAGGSDENNIAGEKINELHKVSPAMSNAAHREGVEKVWNK